MYDIRGVYLDIHSSVLVRCTVVHYYMFVVLLGLPYQLIPCTVERFFIVT